mmetsp:Transcript_5626/g.8404  ORF Transcript_5626/g.8404 Transcript_5626/m.8404 type:complete len:209 (+) Transcript_5626:5470-6096(+)
MERFLFACIADFGVPFISTVSPLSLLSLSLGLVVGFCFDSPFSSITDAGMEEPNLFFSAVVVVVAVVVATIAACISFAARDEVSTSSSLFLVDEVDDFGISDNTFFSSTSFITSCSGVTFSSLVETLLVLLLSVVSSSTLFSPFSCCCSPSSSSSSSESFSSNRVLATFFEGDKISSMLSLATPIDIAFCLSSTFPLAIPLVFSSFIF